MRRLLVLAILAAGLVTAAPAQAASHQVRVEDNAFVPKVLQIDPGDTVEWTTVGSPHTVTADDGRFDFHRERELNAGERVRWTFPDDELVRYFCKIHGGPNGQGMAGVIRVGNPPAAPVPEAPILIVPDDVPTLAAAAAGAKPGTQVLIRPGVYPEEVVVTVPGLHLRGLGERPADVNLQGGPSQDIGITVAADDLRIENLAITGYQRAGVLVDDVGGTTVTNAILDGNGLYGIEARAPAGLAVHGARISGHGVAGIAVRDCVACGTRIEASQVEGNAAGVTGVSATGVVVRDSQIRGNAVGVVLRDVAGAHVTGNAVTDNAATDVWIASVFDEPEPPTGAGLWLSGGRGHLIAHNTVTGHTYNVVVTGPTPAVAHRVTDNTVGGAEHADLGWDGVGLGVCFSGNRTGAGGAASSHPAGAETLYDCARPTAGLPYPIITANLVMHARRAGYPI